MPALLNFFYLSSWTLTSIFIPLIAKQYTDNLFVISLVLGLYNSAVFFSSTVFGRLGDVLGRKRIVLVGFLVSGFVFFAHVFIRDMPSLFMLRGFAGIGAGMLPGPLAALAWGSSLGIFMACGALGFTASSVLAGILKRDELIFVTSALICLIAFLFALFIKEQPKRRAVPLFPLAIILRNLNVYLPYLIRHTAASAIWAIFPIYLAGLGANKLWIGIMYGINPFVQFICMLGFERVKSTRLISIGLVCSTMTFFGYAISSRWETVVFLQILLGFSWAHLFLGSMKYLLENNTEQATATGMLNSIFGLAGILGPLIGGVVLILGLNALLLFSTLLSFVAFIVFRIEKVAPCTHRFG